MANSMRSAAGRLAPADDRNAEHVSTMRTDCAAAGAARMRRPQPSMIAHFLALAVLPLLQDPPATPVASTPAPQIHWQRSLADALAVQQATNRPLLICVNTEGEVFNDRFAGTVYHDAQFITDTDGYVCLIASPERHTDSDYDVDGNRVECPRFPGVTCSEHINVEPALFERWFHGQRAAPRHVGVALDGSVMFDRFLDSSMQTAIDAIHEHKGAPDTRELPGTAAGLLARRDASSRTALEQLYKSAPQASRVVLLDAAGDSLTEPFDLLRLALRSRDDLLFRHAAAALAKTAAPEVCTDVEETLARLDAGELKDALLQRLVALGADDVGCRRTAAWLQAADRGQGWLQQEPWRTAAESAVAPTAPLDRDAIEERLDDAEKACKQSPDDADLRLDLAIANLALADVFAASGNSLTEAVYLDAARAAERAEQAKLAEARMGECLGVQAAVLWQQGEAEKAGAMALAAIERATALGSRCDGTGELYARALRVLADSESATVYAWPKDEKDPGARHVERAVAASAVLAEHPHGTEPDRLTYGKLLAYVGARRLAQAACVRAVQLSPASPAAHEALRSRVIQDLGGEALLARYKDLVAHAALRPTMQWFAGYAGIVVAELHLKDGRKAAAETAYTSAVDAFAASAAGNPDFADSANHFAVLSLAGRALLRHERGDAAGAVADFTAAAQLRPASLQEKDGLGRKPIAMLRRVAEELRAQGKAELADQLAALDR